MSDELLSHYNDELSYIRRLAGEFADAHPKIAGRLRLSQDAIEDPHVARLIEAFAYLNARIRRKLDDDFPELTDAMLGVLYPHYQAPIPSMAIVQMVSAPDLSSPYVVPRETGIDTDPVDGEPCRFRACYATTLWPIEVEAASVSGTALGAPTIAETADTAAVLRLTLRCAAKEMTFSELAPERLRFFVRGQAQHAFPLHELILNDSLQLAVVDANGGVPALLGPESIQPVGFERDEGMLPYPAQAFLGYRLLTEYFAFPQKFLFFELRGLGDALATMGNQVDFWFYCRRHLPALEQNVSAETFALGCTPVVNLFHKRAEPIQLDQTRPEYRVVPDARRPKAAEVYSVDRVTANAPQGGDVRYWPFYGIKHGSVREEARTFWSTSRRAASTDNPGTEVFLSLVDLDFEPSAAADWVVNVDTTCLNRDLPGRLPFGGGQPRLQVSEGAGPIERIECLTAPSATLRPPLKHRAMWRLISHLSLNHLSVSEGDKGAEALREILSLYNFSDSAETRAMIDGVLRVNSRPATARVLADGRSALARGVEITVEFDDQHFTGSGVYLFASVLERFLALYCSLNSFTRMVATIKGRDGVLCRWPARAGEKPLL